MRSRFIVAALAVAVFSLRSHADQKVYSDPDGQFALRIPADWPVERTPLGDGGQNTVIGQDADTAAKIEFVVIPLTSEAAAAALPELSRELLAAIKTELTADGEVKSDHTAEGQLAGTNAITSEIVYKDEDGVAWKATLSVVRGKKYAFVAAAYGLQRDDRGLALAGEAFRTLAIESRTPREPGSAASASAGEKRKGVFTKGSLARAAQSIKGGFAAEAADKVLLQGEPPLTVGSVANFVKFIEALYGIRFTETETQITQERFVEFYGKADAEGRQILAKGGAGLLEGLANGTPEEQTESRRQAKAVFDDRLSNGAKAGIAWASVLWEAIERRGETVRTVKGDRPAGLGGGAKLDNSLSEADLDASMEMLYFMWIAAGRDAALVTPDAVAGVRARLAASFMSLPPDVQYLFANAESVYAQMRSAWQNADGGVRAAYAQQFSAALDQMGLTVPQNASAGWEQPAGGRSGGESEWDIKAGLITNTCWNLAQKSTSGN